MFSKGLIPSVWWNLGGLLLLSLYVLIYFLATPLSPYSSIWQRVRYDENPPTFPRIETKLIRVKRTEAHYGLGTAPSLFATGSALFSKTREIPSGDLICPYAGNPIANLTEATYGGDYLIQVGNILEDGATQGLGGRCNDRLTPEDNNSEMILHAGRIWLRATQHIMSGDEITLSYGWWYWQRRLDRIPLDKRTAHFSKLIELSRFYFGSTATTRNKKKSQTNRNSLQPYCVSTQIYFYSCVKRTVVSQYL